MPTDQSVASVGSVTGQAFARDQDGASRPLMAGDALYDGETLVADHGSQVEVAPEDGTPSFFIDGPVQLAMAPNITTDEGEIDPETLADFIEQFKRGEDMPPPEAGGGGGSRPHNLVMLERILEPVEPMSNEYAATALRGEGPFMGFDISAGLGGGGGDEGGGEPPTPRTPLPHASDDFYTVAEGSHTFQGSVLANDDAGVVVKIRIGGVEYDVPAGAVGLKFGTELSGIVRIMQDGQFSYSAPIRDHGGTGADSDGPDIDHFEYCIKDANGNLSNWATVKIDITDTKPVAVDDAYGEEVFTPGIRFNDNVMANDKSSLDGENIVWKVRATADGTEIDVPNASSVYPLFTTANGGAVWIQADGSFGYQPLSDFKGVDSFQYQLNDQDGSPSNWATVTFNVPGPGEPPLPHATDDAYEVVEGSHTLQGSVLANDDAGVVAKIRIGGVEYDVPATAAGFKFGTELSGIVRIMQDGQFSYSAPIRDHGGTGTDTDGPDIDHFEYCIKDANGNLSNWATVKIDITDTIPIVVNDAYGEEVFTSGIRFTDNVMTNDQSSLDGDSYVWKVRATADGPEIDVPDEYGVRPVLVTDNGGAVWIQADGSLGYQPLSTFHGEDTFQYQLTDQDGSPGNWATVTFNVPGAAGASHENTISGGVEHTDLSGTDGVPDVFKWTLADLNGGGNSVTNTVTNFNADDGDKLDLRDLLHQGDDYLFDTDHLTVSVDSSGTTIVVTPVAPSAPELSIVIEGVDLTGGFEGQNAIEHLLKNGNLVDDK